MYIKKIIWIIIFSTSFGCSKDVDICQKYFQKEYVDLSVKNENLFEEGKIEEAYTFAKEILKVDSNNYVATCNLGAFKYELLCRENECSTKQLKEVYDLYKKSIELCQNYRTGYFNTIEVLAEMANTKYENDREIIDYLEFYNSKWKKRSNLLTIGGEAMFRLGKINGAQRYLDEAIELDPNEAMAYIFKGKCYTSKKEWGKAIESLNIGLSIDSLSLGFHERGYVNNKLGNIDEAIKDYQTAISLYKNRWESYVGIGIIEVNRNKLILACQYFEEAKGLEGANETVDTWIEKYCKSE
jgi:tetratricopeptide (TPR) repeat protein